MAFDLSQIKYGADGLVPCVVQDRISGSVLMLAYMNSEAVERTLHSEDMHFWSRSRNELWRKGETSGNTMKLVSLRYDCDGDSLLAVVDPAGPACHTGERSCFYRDVGEQRVASFEALPALEGVIADRKAKLPQGSYTTKLFEGGVEAIAAKVEEESQELVEAVRTESDRRVIEEAADLLYHTAVLLRQRDIDLDSIYLELVGRMGK